jgi:hypothetical protein
MYRFGPALAGNRQEKLFFWPDRRGRGLQQVKTILRDQDRTAVTVDRLLEKSVAVQGLTALEYVLFGPPSEQLITDAQENFPCRYALALSGAIKANSRDILSGWKNASGFAKLMLTAGPENPLFKSKPEVIRDLLQRADEQILTIVGQKLSPALGEDHETARPRRAPLWRSNLVLDTIDANILAIVALQEIGNIRILLADDAMSHADGLVFEVTQVREALSPYLGKGTQWADILASKDGYEKMRYIRSPLLGAHTILSEYYPAALGITMGFNSMDGD